MWISDKFSEEAGDEDCARSSVGMTQGDRSPSYIDFLLGNFQCIQAGQDLGCEGFIEFDEANVGKIVSWLALEKLLDGGDRACAKEVGINASGSGIDDA